MASLSVDGGEGRDGGCEGGGIFAVVYVCFIGKIEVVDVVVASGRRGLCGWNVRMVYFECLVSPSDSSLGCWFGHCCDCVRCSWLVVRREGGMMSRITTVSFVLFPNIWFCSSYVSNDVPFLVASNYYNPLPLRTLNIPRV